jgi:hypothetical protein
LERPVKKAINVVEKIGADIVEPLERPVKKLTKEVVETVTGTDKDDYRAARAPVLLLKLHQKLLKMRSQL